MNYIIFLSKSFKGDKISPFFQFGVIKVNPYAIDINVLLYDTRNT